MNAFRTKESPEISGLAGFGNLLQNISKVFFTVLSDQMTEMMPCQVLHWKFLRIRIQYFKGKYGALFINDQGISGHAHTYLGYL